MRHRRTLQRCFKQSVSHAAGQRCGSAPSLQPDNRSSPCLDRRNRHIAPWVRKPSRLGFGMPPQSRRRGMRGEQMAEVAG